MPMLARGISHTADLRKKLDSLNDVQIPGVVKWRYTFSEDWSGDPAIFFWVTLTDEVAKDHLAQVTAAFRKFVKDHIDFANDWDLIPYFRFRSEQEQAKLHGKEYE